MSNQLLKPYVVVKVDGNYNIENVLIQLTNQSVVEKIESNGIAQFWKKKLNEAYGYGLDNTVKKRRGVS